jgi:hypothetical protein
MPVCLRAPLRQGMSDRILANLIAERWEQREDRYKQQRHEIASRQGGKFKCPTG